MLLGSIRGETGKNAGLDSVKMNRLWAERVFILLILSKEWDTAPRSEPATGLMSDWLNKGKLEGMIPPPKQSIK